jgi:hypothetical protein
LIPRLSQSQTLVLGQSHLDLQNPGVCDCGAVRHRRYSSIRLGAPAKFAILHSKFGRRVDFARVRYGTMQSKSTRKALRTGTYPDIFILVFVTHVHTITYTHIPCIGTKLSIADSEHAPAARDTYDRATSSRADIMASNIVCLHVFKYQMLFAKA